MDGFDSRYPTEFGIYNTNNKYDAIIFELSEDGDVYKINHESETGSKSNLPDKNILNDKVYFVKSLDKTTAEAICLDVVHYLENMPSMRISSSGGKYTTQISAL